MSVSSKIQWTEATWNPVRGCSRISQGCVNCYAERQAARFCKSSGDYEGAFRKPAPFEGFVEITNGHPRWTGKVELIPEMLDIPGRRKKPTLYFVNSMSDLFHESLPDEAIDRVFAVMALCQQHTFQILTKRSGRMRKYCSDPELQDRLTDLYGQEGWQVILPLPNVWLGVSVEDQANKVRIEELRATPSAVRFISFEPLLEDLSDLNLRGIGLAIWGGESGPGARPCDVAWIRHGMRQARRDGCLNFVKQVGARPIIAACRQNHYDWGDEIGRKARFSATDKMHESTEMWRIHLKDRKGSDMDELAREFRVRQMPRISHRGQILHRCVNGGNQ